jgi:hypothetical protein
MNRSIKVVGCSLEGIINSTQKDLTIIIENPIFS